MTTIAREQRRFHRIGFDAVCELHCGEEIWPTEVVDISLKGILLKRPIGGVIPLDQPCEVVVHLNGDEAGIVMAVILKHVATHRFGFQCQYIDLDSITHLKRLVALNLGDQTLLEREFVQMLESE